MVSVSSVLMAPVRGIVWLVKLPFVLVWMLLRYIGLCIYGAVAAILSVPAHYLGRVRNRLKLTWAWAKGLRLSLPFTSNCSNALPHGSLKALPSPKNEYNTYYLYNTEGVGPCAPLTREDGSSGGTRRRRRSDRKNRKAIAEALTKLLLEPCSPSDSDEEGEAAAMRSSQPEEVEERAVKLIMDLLKLSKSEGDSQVNPTITPQDLQALREHARNKQQLESLIAEVDQMARDVDPSVLLRSKRQGQSSQLSSPSSAAESDQHQPKRRHKTHRSSSSHAKKTSKATRDTYHDQEEEREGEEGEGLEEEESQYTGGAVPLHHRHKYVGDLSPVQESPEYKPEEINIQELEKDLTVALSKLNSEISELPDDVIEETQITHTVTVTSTQQQPSEEDDDSLFQDSHEEFPTVPKVQPSLGLKAGHDRRDIAAARKPRPPTRKTTATEQQGIARDGDKRDGPLSKEEDSWDEEDSELGDLDGSSASEGEGEVPGRYKHTKQRPKKLGGRIELSDQLRLLSPTSKSRLQSENESSVLADSADVASLYASVNKKKKSGVQDRPRTGSDPTPTTTTGHSGLTSRGSSHSMTLDLGDRDLEDSLKEKSSPLIPSSQPPWIEMRVRKNSENSSQPSPTPFSASSQPPWIEMRSHKNVSSSGYSSSASTPTTNAPPSSLHPSPQPTPLTSASSQSTHSAPHNAHAHNSSSHRVFPPKPAIPRPEPPPSSSTSETLLQTYSTEEEEEDENNAAKREDGSENFYDTLQPKEEAPQRESRIFPLDEYRQDRPRYLHEAISDSQREEASSVGSRGRRAGSLRLKDPSPTLSHKSSTPKLKRTSSADTVRRAGKSHDHSKQRHSSSSSARLDERRSSDGHRQRNRSSSGERTPLSQRSSDRHRSSEKHGSTSSSTKSSPSPKESAGTLSTMWKLLATPTSSRRHHSSSGGKKDKDTSKRNGERDKHSSSGSPNRDNSPPSAGSKVKQSASKADKK